MVFSSLFNLKSTCQPVNETVFQVQRGHHPKPSPPHRRRQPEAPLARRVLARVRQRLQEERYVEIKARLTRVCELTVAKVTIGLDFEGLNDFQPGC